MKSAEERRKEYEESIENNSLFKELESLIDGSIREGKCAIVIDLGKFTSDQILMFNGIIEVYKSKGFTTRYPSTNTIILSFL